MLRNIDAGIRYLKAWFPGSWSIIIEDACRRNLRHFPFYLRSTFKELATPHTYGPHDNLICEGSYKDLVFREMLKDGACSAPTFSHEPIEMGKIEVLFPFSDLIVKLVDRMELVVYNVTLPKHIFFPGFVKLAVKESNGKTVVAVSGKGLGNWGTPNELLAPTLFKTIMEEHLIPRVQRQLNASLTSAGSGW